MGVTEAIAVTRTRAAPRAEWVDAARGIGILLVVYGHALRGLLPADGAAVPRWIGWQDALIYAFHMPLFFLLAGLFLERSVAKGRTRFVADKLLTVAYPYLLWSLADGTVKLAVGRLVHHPLAPADLLAIAFRPIEQYWFLYCLFFVQLIACAALPRRALLVAVALAGAAVAWTIGTAPIAGRILYFLPITAAGTLGAGALARLARSRRGQVAVAAAGWAMFALIFLWDAPAATGLLRLYLLAFSGALGTVAVSMLAAEGPAGAPLAALGRASMAIFLAHTLFSAGLRIALRAAGVEVGAVPLLALTTAIGVIGPWLLWRWTVARRLTLLAGFGRGPARRVPEPASPSGI